MDPNPPDHVAVIMDGNGRWARRRQLPRTAGHRAGVENLRDIIKHCVDVYMRQGFGSEWSETGPRFHKTLVNP